MPALADWASRTPDRIAVTSPAGARTFAELDANANRLAHALRRRGLVPSAKLLSMSLQEPEMEVAQALKLTPGERVYCARRLRFVNGEPVAIVTSYLPARLFAGIELGEVDGAAGGGDHLRPHLPGRAQHRALEARAHRLRIHELQRRPVRRAGASRAGPR